MDRMVAHQQQAGGNPHALAKFLVMYAPLGATAPIELGDHVGQPLNMLGPGVHFGMRPRDRSCSSYSGDWSFGTFSSSKRGRLQSSNRCKVNPSWSYPKTMTRYVSDRWRVCT